MASFKLDAAARPLPFGSSHATHGRPVHAQSESPSVRVRPTLRQLISRSGLPLMMIVIVAGTPFWGGYVTLLLAFVLWRLAGVAL